MWNIRIYIFQKHRERQVRDRFLPQLVLTRRGPAPVKPALVISFLENTREFAEITTSTGAKI